MVDVTERHAKEVVNADVATVNCLFIQFSTLHCARSIVSASEPLDKAE